MGKSINNCPHPPDSIEACRTATHTISKSRKRSDAGRLDGVPEFFPCSPEFSKQRCSPQKTRQRSPESGEGRSVQLSVFVRAWKSAPCGPCFRRVVQYASAHPMLRVRLVASYGRDFGHWTRQSIGRTRRSQCASIAGMQAELAESMQWGMTRHSGSRGVKSTLGHLTHGGEQS